VVCISTHEWHYIAISYAMCVSAAYTSTYKGPTEKGAKRVSYCDFL